MANFFVTMGQKSFSRQARPAGGGPGDETRDTRAGTFFWHAGGINVTERRYWLIPGLRVKKGYGEQAIKRP